MTAPGDAVPLAEALDVLAAQVRALAAVALEAGPGSGAVAGRWTGHDVLAHLVHWHEHYADLAEAQRDGRSPLLPEGTFKSLDAAGAAGLAGIPVPALVDRLLAAQTRLEAAAASPRFPGNPVRLKEGARTWAWPELVGRLGGHVRGHVVQLRRTPVGD